MKAIVIGATGATGKELVQQLIEHKAFSEITVWVRKASFDAHPKLKQQTVDFEKLEDYSKELNADVAFSCLGTTLKDAGSKEAQWKVDFDFQFNFAELCKKQNVPTFVLLSAMNADSKSLFFYGKMKGKLEDKIREINFGKLLIFRPGILDRPDSARSGEKISVKVLRFFNQLGLLKKQRPIEVSDLATAMIEGVLKYSDGNHSIPLDDIFQLAKQK